MLGTSSQALNTPHKCSATEFYLARSKVNVKKRHKNPDNKGERSLVLIIYFFFPGRVCVALAVLELAL